MPAPDAVSANYDRQKQLTKGIVDRVLGMWRTLDPSNLDAGWGRGRVGEEIFVTVAAGQQFSAELADPFLTAVLIEQGIDPVSTASVNPRSFAGIAADGRSLETLLYEPIISVKAAMKAGTPLAEALESATKQLATYVGSELADAGRTSIGAGMVARPEVTTWTRYLSPPSCSRCVVLAGKVFKWNQGFLRHPLCDCKHCPTSETLAGDIVTDPRRYFDSLSEADQNKYFTEKGAQSIRDGADLGRIVNAQHRGGLAIASGAKASSVLADTSNGVQRSVDEVMTLVGKLKARPMPEDVITATTSRTAAAEALKRLGYLD